MQKLARRTIPFMKSIIEETVSILDQLRLQTELIVIPICFSFRAASFERGGTIDPMLRVDCDPEFRVS
jgi:hypothetical protein